MNWGAHNADVRIATKNARNIQAALRQGIDAKRVLAAYRRTNPHTSKNQAQDRARARSWAMLNMRINNEPLLEILQKTWADGFVLGQAYGDQEVARAREAKKAASDYIDWDNWKPGDAATATLLRPPKAFQELLGRARVTIKDLDQTGYDRVGTALADSIEQGLSDTRAAKLINDAIGNPARALSIAITETNRAMSYGAISRYKEANLEKMEWATSDPCPTCAMNSGAVVDIGSTFPSGATMPPAHPHCRCAILPVIPEFEVDQNGVVDIAPKPEVYREFTNKAERQEFEKYQLEDKKFMNLAYKEPNSYGKTPGYDALSEYKSYGYGKINDYLRNYAGTRTQHAGMDITKDQIKAIDKVMKAAPGLPEPIVTYRVVGQGNVSSQIDDLFADLTPGDVWIDKGYSSTSLDKEFVENFKTGWLIEVENPAGTKGVMLDGLKGKEGYTNIEDEWLLPRGTKFEVIQSNPEARTMKVKVQQ
jgi:SPP1 gp7 family putative phage head morphogenesis protein